MTKALTERFTMSTKDKESFLIDGTYYLDTSPNELFTGTPTVTEQTSPAVFTVTSVTKNSAAITRQNQNVVAINKGVTFFVEAITPPAAAGDYTFEFYCETDKGRKVYRLFTITVV